MKQNTSDHAKDPSYAETAINLCGRCLSDYRQSGMYRIRRNPDCKCTDACFICSIRQGFEYFISDHANCNANADKGSNLPTLKGY